MAILAIASLAEDIGGNQAVNTTSLNERDPNYSPTGVSMKTPAYSGIAFEQPVTDVLWTHFRFRTGNIPSSGGADGWVCRWRDPSYGVLAAMDATNGTWRAEVRGDSTVYSGDTISPTGNTVFTIDAKLTVSATEVTLELYMNGSGAPFSIATTGNTGGRVKPGIFKLDVHDIDNGDGYTTYTSEWIITDGEDTRGWRLATLEPNTTGNYDQWIGGTSELGDGDPATVASSGTGGERQSWNPTTYNGATSGSIRAVIGKANVGRGEGSSPSQLNQFVRISSTDYDGTAVPIANGEQKQMLQVWDNNPATALPWTTADFATLEMGLLSVT